MVVSAFVDPTSINNPTPNQPIPAAWGDTVADDLNFLSGDRPYCKVWSSVDFAIPSSSTWTAVLFDSDVEDPLNMHSVVSNKSRITMPIGGLYLVGARADIETWGGISSPATACSHILAVWVNGAQVNTATEGSLLIPNMTAQGTRRINAPAEPYRFNAGNYIETMYWTNQPVTLGAGLLDSSEHAPTMWALWIGE